MPMQYLTISTYHVLYFDLTTAVVTYLSAIECGVSPTTPSIITNFRYIDHCWDFLLLLSFLPLHFFSPFFHISGTGYPGTRFSKASPAGIG